MRSHCTYEVDLTQKYKGLHRLVDLYICRQTISRQMAGNAYQMCYVLLRLFWERSVFSSSSSFYSIKHDHFDIILYEV